MMKKTIGLVAALGFAASITTGAFAQGTGPGAAGGSSSGPAAGGNTRPSTAVQKSNMNRGGATNPNPSGGAPGVEGPAGSENGPTQTSPNNGAGQSR